MIKKIKALQGSTHRYKVAPRPKNHVDFREAQSNSEITDKHNVISLRDKEYSPIMLTDQEGLVEIHILSLQLSPFVSTTYNFITLKLMPIVKKKNFCLSGN